MPRSQRHQTSLTSFFAGAGEETKKRARTEANQNVVSPHHWRRQHFVSSSSAPKNNKSRFGQCPICESSLPWHKLENHAATCTGEKIQSVSEYSTTSSSVTPSKSSSEDPSNNHQSPSTKKVDSIIPYSTAISKKKVEQSSVSAADKPGVHPLLLLPWNPLAAPLIPQTASFQQDPEFPPGLYFFPDFISPDEERQILELLDDPDALPAWKMGRFNGQHCGKRWGVHCNLRDRRVDAPEHPLPSWFHSIIVPRLHRLECWEQLAKHKQQRRGPGGRGDNNVNASSSPVRIFTPNEANAIDYRRQRGDWLQAHIDDRKLSTEPIANLSLAGDCYMTFGNTKPQQPQSDRRKEYKMHLPRRGLQILTGPARYNYTHAIANSDLLSDRRVSITMRESPLTAKESSGKSGNISSTPKIDTLFSTNQDKERRSVSV